MKSDAPINENEHVRDDLKAWNDHELPAWRRLRVHRHLARCASCREEAHAMQQLQQHLKSSLPSDADLPPALRARILTQLEEAADQTPTAEPARPWLVRYGFATSLAVNAALILVLVYTGLLRETRTDQTPRSVSAPAVSPQAVPRFHDNAGGMTLKRRPPTSAVKPNAPMPHAISQAPPASNSLTSAPAKQAPLMPPAVSLPSGQATPAANAPAPIYFASPTAGPPPAGRATKMAARSRSRSAPMGLPDNDIARVPSPAQVPAQPAPAFGGGGFGGGLGVAPANGAAGFAPSVQENAPGTEAPAPHSPATPAPPAVALTPAPADAGQNVVADSLRGGAAKPALPSMKARASDRDAPTPAGGWPTLTLPFGVDPSTLGVQAVTVTWDVDERGAASHVRFTTTGNDQVDGAIRAAVYAGRYEPATQHGKPVKSRLTHTFSLTGSQKP